MQRANFRLVAPGIGCLALAVMVTASGVSNGQVLDYLCEGEIRTDRVFEPDGVGVENQRFRVTANMNAGYVKRDRALAAGCFAGRTEVCACEPPSPEKIICRSLGFRADGTEVSLDFTLRPSNGILIVSGREFNARLGSLIETQGELTCTRSPAVSTP